MALRYKIIKGKGVVYVIGSGRITFSELVLHLEELARDSDYKAPMKKLVDYRNIESLDLSMSESDSFANRKVEYSDVFSGERCAIVATLNSSFGVARVHDTLIGLREPTINTMVFRDFVKAQEWLGIVLDADDLTVE